MIFSGGLYSSQGQQMSNVIIRIKNEIKCTFTLFFKSSALLKKAKDEFKHSENWHPLQRNEQEICPPFWKSPMYEVTSHRQWSVNQCLPYRRPLPPALFRQGYYGFLWPVVGWGSKLQNCSWCGHPKLHRILYPPFPVSMPNLIDTMT